METTAERQRREESEKWDQGARYYAEHSRRATAIHEAGHTVAAVLFDLHFKHVTLKPNEGSKGHLLTQNPHKAWEKRERGRWRSFDALLKREIIVLMAGAEAGIFLLGEWHDEGVDNSDIRDIRECVAMASVALELDRLRAATRRLVSKHRDQIEAVALALLELETLTENEVIAIMAPAGPDSNPPWRKNSVAGQGSYRTRSVIHLTISRPQLG